MRRIARTATVLLASTAAAGCQTVGPGAFSELSRPATPSQGGSGYTYGGGRAVQTFAQSSATMQPVVLAALEDLRIDSIRQTSEGGIVIFEGVTADDRNASVMLRPVDSKGTRLVAKVGMFGDQALSRALMDRVGIRLGTLPPSAIPADPPSTPAHNPYFSRSAVSDAEMLRDQADAPYRGTAVPDNRPY